MTFATVVLPDPVPPAMPITIGLYSGPIDPLYVKRHLNGTYTIEDRRLTTMFVRSLGMPSYGPTRMLVCSSGPE